MVLEGHASSCRAAAAFKLQKCPPASILLRGGSWSQILSCSQEKCSNALQPSSCSGGGIMIPILELLPRCSQEELPLWGARQELFQGAQRCSLVWMRQESLWLCSSIDCKTTLTGFRLWLLHVPTDKQKKNHPPTDRWLPFDETWKISNEKENPPETYEKTWTKEIEDCFATSILT